MRQVILATGIALCIASPLGLADNQRDERPSSSSNKAHLKAHQGKSLSRGDNVSNLLGGVSDFSGDFAIPNWTLVNSPPDVAGNFNTNPGPPVELFVVGGDALVGGDTAFEITAPQNGLITFDWGYQSDDIECWDSGGYAVNGAYTILACNQDATPFFSQQTMVPVAQGDTFGFRVQTTDGDFGAGTLGVTNFQFQVLGDPEIQVIPNALSFNLEQDQADSDSISIANVGGGTLVWTITSAADIGPGSCDTPQPAAWLSTTPDMGNTGGGLSTSINVMANATGLLPGTYNGFLCVDSNDGVGNATLPVPVTLEVSLSDVIFADGFDPEPMGSNLEEGFEDVAAIFVGENSWVQQNNSNPLGPQAWVQNMGVGGVGDPGQHAGSPDSSVINGFQATDPNGVGTISTWLLTPEIDFGPTTNLSFWTRAFNPTAFPDRLEVRVCSGSPCTNVGSSETDVGDFGTLLLSVNPNLVGADDPTGANGYPQAAFAQFTASAIDGLPTSGQGRIAFRYFVTDGGGLGANSSTIAIDTVSIQSP